MLDDSSGWVFEYSVFAAATLAASFLCGCGLMSPIQPEVAGVLPSKDALLGSAEFSRLRYYAFGGGTVTPFEIWGDSRFNAEVSAALRYQFAPYGPNLRPGPAQCVALDLRLPLTPDRERLGLEFIRILERHLRGGAGSPLGAAFERAAQERAEKGYGAFPLGAAVGVASVARHRERGGDFVTISFYERTYYDANFRQAPQ